MPVKNREAKLQNCVITKRFDAQDFPEWAIDEILPIARLDIKSVMTIILKKLQNAGYIVDEMHGITHDKDMQKIWNKALKKYDEEPEPIHFHILCRFHKNGKKICSGTLYQIADAIKIEPQCIEKVYGGRFAYDNMLANLLNIRYPDKPLYSPSNVITLQPDGEKPERNYKALYDKRCDSWNTICKTKLIR